MNIKAGYPKDKTIHQFFEAQVEKAPYNTAVIFKNQRLTYRQLNEKANSLAYLLREKRVGPDTIVGIMADRSMEMIIGIFGILKAGGAYLPISPSNPEMRILHLLKESSAGILLTQDKFITKLDKTASVAEIINLEDEEIYRNPTSNLPLINKSGNLVYVIYTSGSTGKPKGVMIEHSSLVNRLFWMQRRYPLGPDDIILQKTPFFFDVSVWEMFWWSMVGAKVCFLMHGGEKFPQAIVETVENNDITVMHFVPSMLSVFLEYLRHSEDDVKRLAGLKRIFASGESLTPSHVKAFNDILFKKNSTRLTNLYGPTEATVDVTYFDCPYGDKGNFEKIPIGKPIDNIELFILGEDIRLQGVGETGELCITGVGLARGYLNRPQLTAEKFPPAGGPSKVGSEAYDPTHLTHPLTPFHSTIYKTGDLARWLPDGNVEFLGRRDQQVKIHGLRIELGEIESVLSRHPLIRDSVLLVKKYSKNVTMLVAYIVLVSKPKDKLSTNELKGYLKTILPDYMVPNLFVTLDRFPLTPNGKVDRSVLPEPTFFS